MGGPGSGRRPKPIPVLKMSGQYRQDRHGRRELDDPATGKPVCPSWLKGEAKKFWQRVVPNLISMGVVRAIDQSDLASMCQWWATWRTHIKDAEHDTQALNAACKAWTHFASLADRFGMNPSARAKLAVPVQKPAEDPASKYFA